MELNALYYIGPNKANPVKLVYIGTSIVVVKSQTGLEWSETYSFFNEWATKVKES